VLALRDAIRSDRLGAGSSYSIRQVEFQETLGRKPVKLGAFDTNIHSMLFWTSLLLLLLLLLLLYCHHRKLEILVAESVFRAACDKSLAHKTLSFRARWIDFHIGSCCKWCLLIRLA
jgi:hypothetical protein